jgi:hypothetical protein
LDGNIFQPDGSAKYALVGFRSGALFHRQDLNRNPGRHAARIRAAFYFRVAGVAAMKRMTNLFLDSVIGVSLCCTVLTGKIGIAPTQAPSATSTPKDTLASTATKTATATAFPTATKFPAATRTQRPSPTSSPIPAPGVPVGDACRLAIDGFNKIRKNLDLPDHFNSGEPYRKTGDFDPNRYFPILKHLKIETGYTLDYVYYLDDWGGKPMIYARKVGDAPFQSYDEFLASIGQERSGESSYQNLPNAFDYLQKIQVDGSAVGYFQFGVLAELGDQFYLSWHALYNDFIILCDSGDLASVERELKAYGLTFPQSDWEKAQTIDFQPAVSINGDAVTIRLSIFSKWGGFWEELDVVDKNNPSQMLDFHQNVLVPYDCGINF